MTKVAIVILNWNGREMMRRFLPSVLESSPEAEVIVADNASTDDSLQMLTSEFPSVRQILLDRNYGFADGYNKALEQVEAEYYVLLNSDVECVNGWLSPLLSYMDAHTEVAACQPKLLCQWQKTHFEYAGAAGGFVDSLGYPYCRGRVMSRVEEDHGQYDTSLEVLWATGACLMIRSKDYWNVGGLDGRFFAHQEEIDLCWRLNARGRKVMCLPQSVAYHLGGGTLPQGNPRKTYLNFRNNLLLLYKNMPEKQLKKVMRIRLFLDFAASMQMLLTGQTKSFKAVWRARADFKRMLPDFQKDREENLLKTTTEVTLSPYCILWQKPRF